MIRTPFRTRPALLPCRALVSLAACVSSTSAAAPPSAGPGAFGRSAPVVSARVDRRAARLEVNGAPFFPFGYFVGVGHRSPRLLADDLGTLSRAGFDTAHVFLGSRFGPEYENVLRAAEAAGVRVMSHPFPTAARFVGDRRSISWTVADDAENFTARRVKRDRRALRRLDPGAVAFASGSAWMYRGRRGTVAQYVDAVDVLGVQVYPIPARANRSFDLAGGGLHEVFHGIAPAVAAGEAKGKPVVANLQTFRWRVRGGRLPTPDEVENMTYQAIAAGARGVLYYVFKNGRTDVRRAPGVWRRTRHLAKELRPLVPFMLEGARATTADDRDSFRTLWRLPDGRTAELFVNASDVEVARFRRATPHGPGAVTGGSAGALLAAQGTEATLPPRAVGWSLGKPTTSVPVG